MGRWNGFMRSSNPLSSTWWPSEHRGQRRKKPQVPDLEDQVNKDLFVKFIKAKRLNTDLKLLSLGCLSALAQVRKRSGASEGNMNTKLQAGLKRQCSLLRQSVSHWSFFPLILLAEGEGTLERFWPRPPRNGSNQPAATAYHQQLPFTKHLHSTQCHL